MFDALRARLWSKNGLSSVDQSFQGTDIPITETPYLATCLRRIFLQGRDPAQSASVFLSVGCSHIPDPCKMTVLLLSAVTIYLEALPLRLCHIPLPAHLIRVSQMLGDYAAADWKFLNSERDRQSMIAYLESLFVVENGERVPRIHELEAWSVCENAGWFKAENRALQGFSVVLDYAVGTVTPLNLENDKRLKMKLSRECCDKAFNLEIFPTVLIYKVISTYAAEEV